MSESSTPDRAHAEAFVDSLIAEGQPFASVRDKLIEMVLKSPLEAGMLIGSIPTKKAAPVKHASERAPQ
jgi:hypothetical protein